MKLMYVKDVNVTGDDGGTLIVSSLVPTFESFASREEFMRAVRADGSKYMGKEYILISDYNEVPIVVQEEKVYKITEKVSDQEVISFPPFDGVNK
jgi:hypothetical protein